MNRLPSVAALYIMQSIRSTINRSISTNTINTASTAVAAAASTTAILFPGQGSQRVGMGRDLIEQYPYSKTIFDTVDTAINQSISSLLFNNNTPLSVLTKTTIAQPGILAHSAALINILLTELNYNNIAELGSITAGHSLGEYTSLYISGLFNLSTAAKLVSNRAKYMELQSNNNNNPSTMCALYPCSIELAIELINTVKNQLNNPLTVLSIGNINSPYQIVLSGDRLAITTAINIARSKDYPFYSTIKRAIELDVSAGFHSILMEPAGLLLSNELNQLKLNLPLIIPVLANYNAQLHSNSNPELIKELLIKQLYSTVQWFECINYLLFNKNINKFIEFGPAPILTGLIQNTIKYYKSIDKSLLPQANQQLIDFNSIQTTSICNANDLKLFIQSQRNSDR